MSAQILPITPIETEEQAQERIAKRFRMLDSLTNDVAIGDERALIVEGPPGLSKSFTVESTLEALEDEGMINYTQYKGYMKATGLYKALYENRDPESVILLDDIDSILSDEVCLNLLKAATDTTDVRRITWGTETKMETSDGEKLPRYFKYEGRIIILTNLDLQALADKGGKLAPHFFALISRSAFLSLSLKTTQDYLIRIRQVIFTTNMVSKLSLLQKEELMAYMEENQTKFRDLSLRTAKKIASRMLSEIDTWKETIEITCFKNQ